MIVKLGLAFVTFVGAVPGTPKLQALTEADVRALTELALDARRQSHGALLSMRGSLHYNPHSKCSKVDSHVRGC